MVQLEVTLTSFVPRGEYIEERKGYKLKEHYTGNKTRNAQVREDLPRARVEQELEALRYQTYVHQQEERDALVARQIALSLEREERQRERELQEMMRLQLRLGDEAMQREFERRMQEEKDEELAKKLQQEEEEDHDDPEDERLMLDQKLAMEAQDAELARMLQEKERTKARKARERARQKKLERERLQLQQQQQQQQQADEQNLTERPQRPDRLDLKTVSIKNRARYSANYSQYSDPEEIQTLDTVDTVREMTNVAAIIDPTYNVHRGTSSSSSSTISPTYVLPTPPQELMTDEVPCYMPIQGQRRNQAQSPSNAHEEKHKRRVKDGCKHQ
ncbi:uncharacterized protein [Temnothorax nylanderi]|uniref:uncharacterized protein isoform X2 n=1 Tax=Temnothorax nylanderi TaxID=102681 RepID=UPI003A892467